MAVYTTQKHTGIKNNADNGFSAAFVPRPKQSTLNKILVYAAMMPVKARSK